MDIFRSEKAPYFLALLVTIIGWHVSQFVTEITRTRAVSYSLKVDRTTRDVVAQIRNVSRTRSLVNATFSIACARGGECLEPVHPAEHGAEAVYGEVRAIPPNATAAERTRNSATSIAFRNTVAAGGVYEIRGRLARPDGRVQFYFLPDAEHPLDIFIYKRRTLTGFVVENYLRILAGSFVLCVLALICSILFNFHSFRTSTSGRTEKKNDA